MLAKELFTRIHSIAGFTFVCRKSHIPLPYDITYTKNTRQYYFFAHNEIKKPLQLLEILSLIMK
jgi:hypothetical protein